MQCQDVSIDSKIKQTDDETICTLAEAIAITRCLGHTSFYLSAKDSQSVHSICVGFFSCVPTLMLLSVQ